MRCKCRATATTTTKEKLHQHGLTKNNARLDHAVIAVAASTPAAAKRTVRLVDGGRWQSGASLLLRHLCMHMLKFCVVVVGLIFFAYLLLASLGVTCGLATAIDLLL